MMDSKRDGRWSVKKQASGSWAVFVQTDTKKSLHGTYASEELARRVVDAFVNQKYAAQPDAKVLPFEAPVKQTSLFGDD
jgi:hypothetical protein